jgi:hypothetical protein
LALLNLVATDLYYGGFIPQYLEVPYRGSYMIGVDFLDRDNIYLYLDHNPTHMSISAMRMVYGFILFIPFFCTP